MHNHTQGVHVAQFLILPYVQQYLDTEGIDMAMLYVSQSVFLSAWSCTIGSMVTSYCQQTIV